MKQFVIIVSLFFFIIEFSIAQKHIEIFGFVANKSDSTPVPYTSVVNKENTRIGAFVDKNGFFKISFSDTSSKPYLELLFSCVGYADTTLVVSKESSKSLFITLRRVVYKMPDVVFYSSKKKVRIIGVGVYDERSNDDYLLKQKNLAIKSFQVGIFLKKEKKDNGKLSSVRFCLSEKANLEGVYLMRILIPKMNILPDKFYPVSEFQDLFNEWVIIDKVKTGWNEVYLEDYNLKVPSTDFLVLFSIAGDKKEDIDLYSDSSPEWYVSPDFFLENKGLMKHKWAYGWQDKVFYLSKTNSLPAINVKFWNE